MITTAAFRKELIAATRRALDDMRRSYPGERFYAFALVTSPDVSRVAPSFSSEEGLSRPELRWSPSGWPYVGEAEQQFDRAAEMLDALRLEVDDDDDALARLEDELWEALHRALEDLDRQGVFGEGAAREQLVVNVLFEEPDFGVHVASARRLNPPATFRRFGEEALAVLRRRAQELELRGGEELERVREQSADVEAQLEEE